MKNYFIEKLSAVEILNTYKKDKKGKPYFLCDFSSDWSKFSFVIDKLSQKNNAIYDQVNMAINESYDPDSTVHNPDALVKTLFILDFNGLKLDEKCFKEGKFNPDSTASWTNKERETANKLWELYHKGFYIKFGDAEEKHYRFFEHSAGMVRNKLDYFICDDEIGDSTLKKLVNERLLLGIDFNGVDFNPAKYYAYRGLYLTDGWRVKLPELNEKTVVVIKDCLEDLIYSIDVLTAELSDDNIYRLKKTNEKPEINLFDGQGIISFEFADKINACLENTYGQKGDATSFQFRMPFGKGMLHKVDFKKFFVDELGCEPENIYITDYFGRPRCLADAEIILSESQFKFASQLNKKYKKTDIDPMKEYFEGYHKYHHAMYIHATSLGKGSKSNTTRFTYQFVNALPKLESSKFEEVVEENIDPWFSLPDDKKDGEEYKVNLDNPDENFKNVMNALSTYCSGTKMAALKKNPYFLKEKSVGDDFSEYNRSELKKIVDGKFKTAGTERWLTRDLLYFLIYVAKNSSFDTKDMSEPNGDIEDKLEKIGKHLLPVECIYMPNSKGYFEGKYYSVFRNPCYSKYEPCLMRYHNPGNLYEKYFSHLTEVVFISRTSIAAMSCGGADFDGDWVRIIKNKRINDAVKACSYEEKSYEKNGIERKVLHRSLPVVNIPSGNAKTFKLHNENESKFNDWLENSMTALFNGFSSSIGRISNIGVLLTKAQENTHIDDMSEYDDKAGEDDELAKFYRTEYINICKHIKTIAKNKNLAPECDFDIGAYSTILGGVEIDKAKTNVSSEYNFVFPNTPKKAKYLSFVNKTDGTISRFNFHESVNKSDANGLISIKNSKGEKLFDVFQYDEYVSNIDNLPYFFGKHFNRAASNLDLSNYKGRKLFDLGNAKDEKKKAAAGSLVRAYAQYNEHAKTYNSNNKGGKDVLNKIKKLLVTKYDGWNTEIAEKLTLQDALIAVEALLPDTVKGLEEAYKLLFVPLKNSSIWKPLKNSENYPYWMYIGNDDAKKTEILKSIMEIKAKESNEDYELMPTVEGDVEIAVKAILFDFRYDGYKLLPLIIRHKYENAKRDESRQKVLNYKDNETIDNKKSFEKLEYDTDLYDSLLAEMMKCFKKFKNIDETADIAVDDEIDDNDDNTNYTSSLEREIIKICRNYLEEQFRDGDNNFQSDEAIKYLWRLKSRSMASKLFWQVFTADEITSSVYAYDSTKSEELEEKLSSIKGDRLCSTK